jgi:hypothetical protein
MKQVRRRENRNLNRGEAPLEALHDGSDPAMIQRVSMVQRKN